MIEKALAKTPAERYPSMARFAEALAVAGGGRRTPTPAPEIESGTVANNLPRQRTHFIGRERELAECARLMGDTRLLALTGEMRHGPAGIVARGAFPFVPAR